MTWSRVLRRDLRPDVRPFAPTNRVCSPPFDAVHILVGGVVLVDEVDDGTPLARAAASRSRSAGTMARARGTSSGLPGVRCSLIMSMTRTALRTLALRRARTLARMRLRTTAGGAVGSKASPNAAMVSVTGGTPRGPRAIPRQAAVSTAVPGDRRGRRRRRPRLLFLHVLLAWRSRVTVGTTAWPRAGQIRPSTAIYALRPLEIALRGYARVVRGQPTPIFDFNVARSAIVDEVVARVCAAVRDPLLVLNDAAYHETRRLGPRAAPSSRSGAPWPGGSAG